MLRGGSLTCGVTSKVHPGDTAEEVLKRQLLAVEWVKAKAQADKAPDGVVSADVVNGPTNLGLLQEPVSAAGVILEELSLNYWRPRT